MFDANHFDQMSTPRARAEYLLGLPMKVVESSDAGEPRYNVRVGGTLGIVVPVRAFSEKTAIPRAVSLLTKHLG
jgi:hypothetical protein